MAPRTRTPLSQDEIKSIVRNEITQAVSYASTASADRQRALDLYLGKPLGDEREGRSQVVTSEVRDTCEWILPSLLRLFTTSENIVQVEPTEESDIQAAEQATDLLNVIWSKDNPGFVTLHNWFKDGLLHRLGVVKVWWQPEDRVETLAYRGLVEEQVAMLLEDKSLEITGVETYPGAETMVHDVKLRRTVTSGRVVVECVPPEEFVFLGTCKRIEDDGVGHKRQMTLSDLRAAGYPEDILDDLPGSDDDADPYGEKAHRNEDDAAFEDNSFGDGSMKLIDVCEWYTRLDLDGTGVAQKVKVTMAGGELLDIEEVSDNPFAALSPILMPHRLVGLSIADLVEDIQRIKSQLTRQMMDSLYLANNPRTWAVDNQVNLSDLMTNRPGGVVRVRQPGMIGELNTQFVAGAAFPMLEYLDQTLEGRTGVSRMMQGLDADALRKGGAAQTATGVAALQSAAQSRVELIARIYSEGVRRAFELILANVTRYQDQPRVVRLRGKFIPIDPRSWVNKLDLSVSVGLGTGNKTEQMAYLGQVLTAQKEALAAGGLGLVRPKHIFNTLEKMVQLAGLKTVEPYFSDPEAEQQQQPQQPPKPDPQQMMIEMTQQVEMAKLQLAREKMIREDDRERDELDAEITLRAAEITSKYGAQVDVASIRAAVERDREAMRQAAAQQQQIAAQQQQQQPPGPPMGQPQI